MFVPLGAMGIEMLSILLFCNLACNFKPSCTSFIVHDDLIISMCMSAMFDSHEKKCESL